MSIQSSNPRDEGLNEFHIPSAVGGGLTFYDRFPTDKGTAIEHFWVRIADDDLSVFARVYAGYVQSHPAHFFADMARQWKG